MPWAEPTPIPFSNLPLDYLQMLYGTGEAQPASTPSPTPGQGLDFPGSNLPTPPPYWNPGAGMEAVNPDLFSGGSDFPGADFPTELPSPPGAEPDVLPPTQAFENNPAPWYPGRPQMTWGAGGNVYGTPPAPGIISQLKAPTNWSNVTGALGKAAGSVGNFLAQPGYHDPGYLASIGYEGGQGFGSQYPGGVTGPVAGAFDVGAGGVAGQGGSFFHGGASAGMVHGAGPIPGAFGRYGLGGGGPNQFGGTTWGNIMARNYMMRMMKGLYTTPQQFGSMKESSPSPFPAGFNPYPGGSPTGGPVVNNGWNWSTFHQGQVQLGDILRANPALLSSIATMEPGQGQGIGSRHTAPILPK